ncbi:hypothetical protein [Thalassospira alkalitolerans]
MADYLGLTTETVCEPDAVAQRQLR